MSRLKYIRLNIAIEPKKEATNNIHDLLFEILNLFKYNEIVKTIEVIAKIFKVSKPTI